MSPTSATKRPIESAALGHRAPRFGARVDEQPDGLVIDPPAPISFMGRIATYNDHRMAMSFALAGLASRSHDPRPRLRGQDLPRFLDRTWNDSVRHAS